MTADRGALALIASIAGKVALAIGFVFLDQMGRAGAVADMLTFGGIGLLALSLMLGSQTTAETRGALEIGADDVLVHIGRSATRLPRREITSAYVVRQSVYGRLYVWVEIRTRAGTTYVVSVDEPTAHALVLDLGFGPTGRVVRIDLARRSRRALHLALGYAAYMAGIVASGQYHGEYRPLVALFTISVVYVALKRLLRAPIVRIGTDAIEVAAGVARRRVRRSDLVRVRLAGPKGPLVLELRDEKSIRIHTVLVDDARLGAAIDVANQRLGAWAMPERAAAFERGGRDVAAWRGHVRALLDGGYREAGVTAEDAVRVVGSASATLDQRFGAALALRASGAPLDAVRIASEGALDPDVRRVFDELAAGDDVRVQEALGKVAR